MRIVSFRRRNERSLPGRIPETISHHQRHVMQLTDSVGG